MNSIEQQLVADMKDAFPEFKCTIQDLRDPKEEFVTSFYCHFLTDFEVDINNINQVQFSQSEIVGAHQDAYSGIIPKINLLKTIRSFEIVPDFGMLDIISPTPKRTQALLKGFINFYKCADDNVGRLREKKTNLDERKLKLIKITEQKEELRENLNCVTKNIAVIQDDKAKLEEETQVLEQETSELRMEKEVVKQQTHEINEKLREKETAVQKVDKEVVQVTNKIKEYSNMIVDSPTTILSDLDTLRQKQQQMNELSCQKRDLVEIKMQSHKKILKLIEDQQLWIQQLDEILKLIDQNRELQQVVSTSEKNTAICLEQLNELKSLLLAQSTKKRNCQEALQSLLLNWKTLKPKLTEQVESALRKLNIKKDEKKKMDSQLKEDAAVKESIASLMQKIKIFVENLHESYNKLRLQESEQFDILDSNLKSDMENKVKEAEKKHKRYSK